MADHIARNDALVVEQVTVITPTAGNNEVFDLRINTKVSESYTSDASGTAQEIVEGLQPLLDALEIPEFAEITWTEDDATIIATGPDTGQPFTIVDGPGDGAWASISTTAGTPKSPNHWIAENFDSGALPANGDTVYVTGLTPEQGFYWGLDQSAVTLTNLHILADSEAYIGLPEWNEDSQYGAYYQGSYRDTFLKLGITNLFIGAGDGAGSGRIKINLGSVNCNATIYQTSQQRADQDEAPVHLLGGNTASTLQVISGDVDLAMKPGTTGSWATLTLAGSGIVRLGQGVTVVTIDVGGNASVETRSAVTTYTTRENGSMLHIGTGNITTLTLSGGNGKIVATGALTVAQLNGYAGKTLDLSECEGVVTFTNMTIYGTTDQPFTIIDPLNKMTMTNAASCVNGAQGLVVRSGAGRNVRLT